MRRTRVTSASGGQCARALESRLPTAWRRRASSPRHLDRALVGCSSSGRSGSIARASATSSVTSRTSRPAPARAGGPGRAGPAAAGRRPARPCAPTRLRSGASRCPGRRALGGATPEQLRVAAHRGERRAQLVGGVGHEPPQPVLGRLSLCERLLDLAEHRVQRDPEAADLRARVGLLHPPGQVAGRDLGRRALDSRQRAHAHADQGISEATDEGQHDHADDHLVLGQLRDRRVHVAQRGGR